MTKTKTTKRALFGSVIALALCFTMLLGTTYAWFTDSAASSGNIIQSGTLNIDLLVKGGDTGYTDYTSVKTQEMQLKSLQRRRLPESFCSVRNAAKGWRSEL